MAVSFEEFFGLESKSEQVKAAEKELKKQEKEEKKNKKYYDRTAIDETGALYRMIMGSRSNGKTYSICRTAVERYFAAGERLAYVRRYDEEIMPKNLASLFDPHKNLIISLSQGRYNGVSYRAKEFHFCFYDEEGKIQEKDPEAFCITASINTSMTTKGADRGEVKRIVFDEFMTRDRYLKDEFVMFQNLLSSLIRDREDTIVYMLANTVNKYCPYFEEMGLTGASRIKQGSIQVYQYGDSGLTVALEYCPSVADSRNEVNKYFAFDNPQLKMISTGEWEIALYDRCPFSIHEEDILKDFYILFQDEIIVGQLVRKDKDYFIFFYKKTRDFKPKDRDIVLCDFASPHIMWTNTLKDKPTRAHQEISLLIQKRKVFFATNQVGETVRNFFMTQDKFDIRNR